MDSIRRALFTYIRGSVTMIRVPSLRKTPPFPLGPDTHSASSRSIGCPDSGSSYDNAAGRKIAFNMLHQIVEIRFGILQKTDNG
jgi:hypothetical protein